MSSNRVVSRGLNFLIGFKYRGESFKSFTLQPPRGRLRREFSNAAPGGMFKARLVALKHIIQSLGALDPLPTTSQNLLTKLSLPDVDLVDFFATYAACNGKLSWEIVCPHCSEETTLKINMDDVEILPGGTEVQFTEEGLPFHRVSFFDPVQERDVEVAFRIPTLADQGKLSERLKDGNNGDLIFQNFATLMHSYDGGAGLTVAQMDDLPLPTFDALSNVTQQKKIVGIDTEVRSRCPQCSGELVEEFPVDRWLAPFVGLKQ